MSPHHLSSAPLPASAPAQTVVRMRSPGEIVSAVPFLLGFVPEDSVVIIGLRSRRLGLTCRLDLGDVLDDDEALEAVMGAFRREGVDGAILVGFGRDREDTGPPLVTARRRLLEAGFGIFEEVSVVAGRWFHEVCSEERCCPPEGTPVVDHDAAPSTLALSAAMGAHLANREEVAARCSPDQPLLVAAIRSELDRLQRALPDDLEEDVVVSDLVAVLGWGGNDEPTPTQRARAALLTTVPLVRDVWYALAAPGMMIGYAPDLSQIHERVAAAGLEGGDLDRAGILVDSDARRRVLGRLLAWVRNLPDDRPEAAMGPLVIAAMAHWCAGDGAYASVLTERAGRLRTTPLGMLHTLHTCIAHGLREPSLGWLAPEFAAAARSRRSRRGRRRGGGGPTRVA